MTLIQSLFLTDGDSDLNATLARELFRRTKFSAFMGSVGVSVMAYTHLSSESWLNAFGWFCVMLVLLVLRFLGSRWALIQLDNKSPARQLIALDAIHSALIGLGWGASLYVFDTGTMDQNYHFRVLILAVTFAVVVFSTGVIYQVFLAYTLPIATLALCFVATHDYVGGRSFFFVAIPIYMLVLFAMARVVRRGVIDHQALLKTTEALNQALTVEKQLRREMTSVALTDELTGIPNRRGILNYLDIEVAKARRHGLPLSVLVIDIDHFKQVNDTLGHASGDTVIRAVSNAAVQVLRESDALGRIGGDEILAVLPSASHEDAVQSAERLRMKIEILSVNVSDASPRVTLSIGAATLRSDEDGTSLMARADDALYLAKRNGRNQVALAPTELAA